MKSYDEMDEIEYYNTVRDYAVLYGAPEFDSVDEESIKLDFEHCIQDGGDGFLETMTPAELDSFVKTVAREAREQIEVYYNEKDE